MIMGYTMSDKSIEDIDIIKLLIYVIIFLIISAVMIFSFIVPNIKEYRQIESTYISSQNALLKIQKNFENTLNQLHEIEKTNEFTIKSLNNKFSEISFTTFANKYFNNVSLNELPKKDQKDDFYRYELNVTSAMNTPSKFYNFLDDLKKYENVVKVDFPINMKSDGNLIHATFNIRIYGGK